MTARQMEKWVKDLAELEKSDFDVIVACAEIEIERENLRKKEIADALNAFQDAWERMEELGYCAVLPSFFSDGNDLEISCISWREIFKKEG